MKQADVKGLATWPATSDSRTTSRSLTALKIGAAVAVLFLAFPDAVYVPHPSTVDQVVLVASLSGFGVAGLIAWIKRPDSWMGPLMILFAFVTYVREFGFSTNFTLFVLGAWAATIPVAVIAHLVLTYPSGRTSSRLEFAVILALYGTCLLEGIVNYEGMYKISVPRGALIVGGWIATAFLFRMIWNSGPRRPIPLVALLASAGFLTGLIVSYNILDFVLLRPSASDRLFRILTLSRSLVSLLALVLVAYRFLRASRPTRRGLMPIWASMAVLALITAVSWSVGWHPSDRQAGLIVRWILISATLIPVAYLWGLLRVRFVRGTVGKLVIELGGTPSGGLRGALARTLRDPSLELAFWLPDPGRYVDGHGRPVELPDDGSRRTVTLLEREGEPLAALIHDPALANEPEVVEAAAAAARLALENERLHAEVKAQLEQVRASRARIVEAADEERRKVEQDLHDGAQQRLVSLSLAIRQARAQLQGDGQAADLTLAQADDELRLALTEIRELAQGIHPAVLTEDGLAAALDSLTERSSVPARIVAAPAGRLPTPVEVTAYFVVSEALANVAKYAGASDVTITVSTSEGRIVVEIVDDGVGGAELGKGRGLRGLEDRVVALDGTFTVDSPPGHGTRIVAVIPCA